jgi:hypothetical protein
MSIITNKVQLAIIDDFVHDLETSMGIRHEKVSFNELWSISPPKAAGNLSLEDYMKDVCKLPMIWKRHRPAHKSSRSPETHSSTTTITTSNLFETSTLNATASSLTWALQSDGNGQFIFSTHFGQRESLKLPDRKLSSTITRAERDVAVEKLEIYKEWFLDVVMKREKRDTLVLIPIENISPRYRDDPPLWVHSFIPSSVWRPLCSQLLGPISIPSVFRIYSCPQFWAHLNWPYQVCLLLAAPYLSVIMHVTYSSFVYVKSEPHRTIPRSQVKQRNFLSEFPSLVNLVSSLLDSQTSPPECRAPWQADLYICKVATWSFSTLPTIVSSKQGDLHLWRRDMRCSRFDKWMHSVTISRHWRMVPTTDWVDRISGRINHWFSYCHLLLITILTSPGARNQRLICPTARESHQTTWPRLPLQGLLCHVAAIMSSTTVVWAA